MTRWKPDQETFTVKVQDSGKHYGVVVTIPRPLFEELGCPPRITFKKKNGRISVIATKK